VVAFGGIRIDGTRREVTLHGEVVAIAAREFALIWFLVDHVGQALTRRQILDGAWGDGWIGDERTVDVHVRQLRRKLGEDLPLETVRGVGYRLG
jgi:DNA-binding response OmpR family regulator